MRSRVFEDKAKTEEDATCLRVWSRVIEDKAKTEE
jgi:hypothetical protein